MAKKISALIGHEGNLKRVEYEVPEDEPGFWGADHEFSIAGKKRVTRLDALEKVTGRAILIISQRHLKNHVGKPSSSSRGSSPSS